jgi:hypothetical protein
MFLPSYDRFTALLRVLRGHAAVSDSFAYKYIFVYTNTYLLQASSPKHVSTTTTTTTTNKLILLLLLLQKNAVGAVYTPTALPAVMAKAKTAVFTLTEEIPINAVTASATIPIGSLIDVGDAQALEIVSVDFIFNSVYQTASSKFYAALGSGLSADSQFCVQLTDKNVGTTISPADNNMIASAQCHYDAANIVSSSSDFYPDDWKGTNGRFVVNDEMYVQCRSGYTFASNFTASVTLRIQAKIVKLSTRDWMAISLETVQNE